VIGTRKLVRNDGPIIGTFGVNSEGSGDMYYKGGNMLHTIRQIVHNDDTWRDILRGLNKTFWHQTVAGRQIEDYISQRAGVDLTKVFDQYLTTTMIPRLEYRISGSTLSYRWANVVAGFDMPVAVTLSDGAYTTIKPGTEWKTVKVTLSDPAGFKVDENYYVTAKNMGEGGG
jgi:aminopeptidase N